MNFKDGLFRAYIKNYTTYSFYLFSITSILIGIGIGFVTNSALVSLLSIILLIMSKKSKKLLTKYILTYASLGFFTLVFYYYHPQFQSLALVIQFISAIYAYLMPDIISANISGTAMILILHLYIGEVPGDRILYNVIGIIVITIFLSIVFKLNNKIILERNKYKDASTKDSLTGLINFTHIINRGQKMIDRGTDVAVLIIDLDYFKQINDAYGHVAGNKVIIKVANTLKDVLDGYDSNVGRLGGDEFIVLIKRITISELNVLVEKLNQKLNKETFYKEPKLPVIKISCSIGKAENVSNKSRSIEELIHLADMDMYYNKNGIYQHDLNLGVGEVFFTEQTKQVLRVIQEKDKYTYVHSQFVAKYSVQLGRELGLSEEEIKELYIAGWLHDIGKIFISNSILKKPGKLTDEEHNLIKHHVNIAVNNLDTLGLSKYNISKDSIKYHHERWDGKGYPFGITGNEIPIWARILQIADVYSAITVKRVHKERVSVEDAINELKRCSGTQLDPKLVTIFIKTLRDEIMYLLKKTT